MSISSTRRVLVTLILLVTAFTVSCAALREKRSTLTVSEPAQPIEEKRSYLTVTEAFQRAKLLEGKQVRVRGYGFFNVMRTNKVCTPASCDCNTTHGHLVLFEETGSWQNWGVLDKIFISASSLSCQGDECSMECIHFDPTIAKEFEFAGTLVDRDDFKILYLEDIDLEASRQLIDDEWIPIETGRFTVELGKK